MQENQTNTEVQALKTPEVLVEGYFAIPFLAHSLSGLELKTRNALLRRENLSVDYPKKEINQANKRESKFWQQKDNDVKPLRSPSFKPKIGISNFERNNDDLFFDTRPLTYVMYNDDSLAFTKPEKIKEGIELGGITGAAMILLTTEEDGSSKIILQHRGVGNRAYKDIPGASVAGLMDGELYKLNSSREKTARLKDVNTETVRSFLRTEMDEELGLKPEDIGTIIITGLGIDLIRSHYEFLGMAKVNISASEVERKAEENGEVIKHPFDFSEKMFVIDNSADAIDALLTQVRCPLPSTHTAAFLAMGYFSVLENKGKLTADEWKDRVTKGILDNYREIDRLVNANTNNQYTSYQPKLTPQEQGLPTIILELQRTHLIS